MNTAVLTDLAAEGQFLPVNVFTLSSTRVFETACGPLGPVEVFWWKICFLSDSAPAYTVRTNPVDVGRILDSGGSYSPDWICWTSLPAAFFRRKSRLGLTPIWLPYVCPSTQNGTSHWRNTSKRRAAHSAAAIKPMLRKIKLKLYWWLANSPPQTNRCFSGLK